VNKVGRSLSATAVTIGLAVVATGCSSNVIGADGPRPGIAAQVEDAEITLDDLTAVTDGLCTLQAADPNASATSREFAQTQILQAWVAALVEAEFGEDRDVDVTPPDAGLDLAPGWDDVDEDDRDPLRAYVDAFVYSSAVDQALAGEKPDSSVYDISINPRFDVKLEGADFVPAGGQLSVPVSDEAAADAEAPTAEAIQALPDNEICGQRPDPVAAPPPVPVG
jgi:hypothetical protein